MKIMNIVKFKVEIIQRNNLISNSSLDLFWSDPDPQNRQGCRKNDARKMACFFGSDITEQFLKQYKLSMIIRSHQVKQTGYEFTHNGKVLTVFSASNYCGGSNWGAIIRWFALIKNFFFDLNIKFRDYNEEEPWLISFKTEMVEMEKLSFSKKYDHDGEIFNKSSFLFDFKSYIIRRSGLSFFNGKDHDK